MTSRTVQMISNGTLTGLSVTETTTNNGICTTTSTESTNSSSPPTSTSTVLPSLSATTMPGHVIASNSISNTTNTTNSAVNGNGGGTSPTSMSVTSAGSPGSTGSSSGIYPSISAAYWLPAPNPTPYMLPGKSLWHDNTTHLEELKLKIESPLDFWVGGRGGRGRVTKRIHTHTLIVCSHEHRNIHDSQTPIRFTTSYIMCSSTLVKSWRRWWFGGAGPHKSYVFCIF